MRKQMAVMRDEPQILRLRRRKPRAAYAQDDRVNVDRSIGVLRLRRRKPRAACAQDDKPVIADG
jgi:hypothetical protein